jgi:photosystem II oxygen-evolving enhancer protein 3
MAGIAGLTLNSATFTKPAQAIAPEIRDDRKAKENGFDLIYEARDIDLPQNTRDGFTQARTSLDQTKKRVAESERRIDAKLQPYISKKYWTEAREELRLQLGTLRFDLETLAGQLPKPDKKKALALKKTFFSKADDLDYAIRTKDQPAAEKALAITKSSLDAVLGAVA